MSKNIVKSTPATKTVTKATPKAKKVLTPTEVTFAKRNAELKKLRAEVKVLKAKVITERKARGVNRKAAAIAKAKAKLEALLNPAGAKAAKAARKPGPVTVTTPATAPVKA